MDFRLLGPLEVVGENGAADVGTGKRAALLTCLLINANEVVSVERLIDELWGEHPPATAAKSVQVYVSQLRKALQANGDVLMTHGGGYVLRLEVDELDIKRFERALTDAQGLLDDGNAEGAARATREALALWRGPALYDVAYESFAQNEVARLNELRLIALETRIEAELALGKHAQLVGELEALVAQHPSRERFRAQLMVALYRCGRQSDALAVYRHGTRVLMDDLGLEPSPELRELEQKILAHSADLGASRMWRPRAPRRSPPSAATVGGRRKERRGVWLLVVGGGVLAAAVGLAMLQRTGGGSTKTQTGDSVVVLDPATGRTEATVAVGYTPTSVAVGAGAVWALNADDQTISRIDPESKHVETFGVGATPTDLAAGGGALWVGAGGGDSHEVGALTSRLLRVDVVSHTVRARVDLPAGGARGSNGAPGQVAVGDGAVWVVGGGNTLARLDPRSARVTAVVHGLSVRSIAVGSGSVWATVADSSDLAEIDARTARVRRRVSIPAAHLDALAVGAGAVWVADAFDGTLWRVEPGAKITTKTIDVGAGVDGVAVGAGRVWVMNGLRGTIARIDPQGNAVTKTIAVGGTPRDLAIDAHGVWVALAGSQAAIHAGGAKTRGGLSVLPRSTCSAVQSGGRTPDYLIASDFPLQMNVLEGQALANAVGFVLRQHHFRAGRFSIGTQSCDDATPESGQSDPQKCAANAKMYAGAPAVIGVVGPLNSGCALAEIPILNRTRGGPLALVSGTNDVVGLTRPDPTAPNGALRDLYPAGIRNYARVDASELAEAAANALLARRLGLRRVYVLDDGTDFYGVRNAVLFRRAARREGLRIVGTARWNPGGGGFAALPPRIRRAHADGVFLSGLSTPPLGRLLITLRARLGTRTPLIAPIGLGPIDFIYDTSHGAAAGLYSSASGLPNDYLGSRGQRFLRDFGATQPGLRVGEYSIYTAAATEVLLDAIARSDGTRASVTRALLTASPRRTVIGPVSFDKYGDVKNPAVTIFRISSKRVSRAPYSTHGAVYDVIVPPAAALR
jgi:YVTN family beta-propeller protein